MYITILFFIFVKYYLTMAFIPKLEICFINCEEIRFIDTTNVYNVNTNTSGWGSANTAESTDVDTAIITILDSDDATVLTYDVTTQLPVPVTGDITFLNYVYDLPDGEYTLEYNITFDSGIVYTFSEKFQNYCAFECCVNKLIATIPGKICSNPCDTDYIDEVLLVEGLFYGFLCATSCDKETIKTEIESSLTRFCDFQCNDC